MSRSVALKRASVLAPAVGAVMCGVAAASAPIQYVVGLALVATVALLGDPRSLVLSAFVLSLGSGLIRRLLAGSEGRVDNDIFVVIPLAMVVLALAIAVASAARGRRADSVTLVLLSVPFLIAVSVVLSGSLSLPVLYGAMAQAVPFLTMAAIRTGLLPDVWPTVLRILPLAMVIAGTYGVLQFVVLPEWDRAWLVASKSVAFGEPYPFRVRVFGMSDSPGPYAALLGAAIVIGASRAARTGSRGWTRLGWALWSGLLLVPLVLTGVRAALVCLIVVIVAQAVVAARGVGRLTPLWLIGILVALVVSAVNRFGATSSILTAGRLTSFDASTDTSLTGRSSMLSLVPGGLTRPFGAPAAGHYDNLVVDTLLQYGPAAAAAVIVVIVIIAGRAWRSLRTADSDVAGVTLFLLAFSLAGNLFVSTAGVLAAIAFGAIAVATPTR